MKRNTAQMFLTIFLVGLCLSGCATTTYVPNTRDVTETAISGNYWSQQFTLYVPSDRTLDCPISRTGTKIDLNSSSELADAWRKFCRNPTDHSSQSN